DLAAGTETGEQVGVTGRVIFVRNTGKLCFAMLREGEAELQVMLSLDRVGAESLAAWKSDVDLGDLVFVAGEVISSKRGELSVLADEWRITAKALRPLPVALRRSHRPPGGAPDGAHPVGHPAFGPLDVPRPRFCRGGNAGAAGRARRCGGASVPHTPECIRPGHVAAYRHRAVSEAVHRRRHREGVRARTGIPQRGRRLQ